MVSCLPTVLQRFRRTSQQDQPAPSYVTFTGYMTFVGYVDSGFNMKAADYCRWARFRRSQVAAATAAAKRRWPIRKPLRPWLDVAGPTPPVSTGAPNLNINNVVDGCPSCFTGHVTFAGYTGILTVDDTLGCDVPRELKVTNGIGFSNSQPILCVFGIVKRDDVYRACNVSRPNGRRVCRPPWRIPLLVLQKLSCHCTDIVRVEG
jgi:hypothetical protein